MIVPVTGPAVIFADEGFTVIVKVVGVPIQFAPLVTKLPSDIGLLPTVTVLTSERFAVLYLYKKPFL